ncbi:MAG: 23S rRNA (guanosine(2251)-2'-O)-methyltransferase RlmB, partial [Muribaculaceae bacterium]|nr:23S rRNA (guanosine(2251)-2'-O)-methyltransferase RlmB [Muribaculaceae bacterium]
MKDFIFGIRPVIEALQAATSLDTIYVKKDLRSELTGELLEAARQVGVPVKRVPVERLNRLTSKNHQGVVATVAAVTYYKVEQVVPMLYDNGENPLLVVLDGVTDVRNFGALARTADCAGVSALVIPERDSVSVNADAVKTSAGALNYVPVCRERNLV